eukprot:scaffold1440_cov167-Amphora_coffeaeformis.AAC.1
MEQQEYLYYFQISNSSSLCVSQAGLKITGAVNATGVVTCFVTGRTCGVPLPFARYDTTSTLLGKDVNYRQTAVHLKSEQGLRDGHQVILMDDGRSRDILIHEATTPKKITQNKMDINAICSWWLLGPESKNVQKIWKWKKVVTWYNGGRDG